MRNKSSGTEKSGIQKIGNSIVEIPSIGFFGPYAESPNLDYLIAWSDFDPSYEVGGYRKMGHGSYVLVKNGNVICSGQLERPNDGQVANNGTFVLADWLFGDGLKSIFYTFSSNGNKIIHHTFSANMLNTGLSESGQFAVVQLANSDSDDGGCLAFFDLFQKELLWKQVPIPGWANSYQFNDETKRLGLIFQDKGIYEYTYDGVFADSARWDEDRIKYASGFELVSIAQEKLKQFSDTRLKQEDADDILNILKRALKTNLNKYPNEQAKAYRVIGEVYETLGDVSMAIEMYEKAIKLDPKVGVKRQLEKLKKQQA